MQSKDDKELMISIIVSSYKPDLFAQFERSVAETIGVEYEIIQINNPGKMGLCKAYNIGTEKAKYEYLCFAHEDILFQTKNWGKVFISIFENDSKIGVIGIAGSSYKTWVPSGWSFDQDSTVLKRNYIQINNSESFHVYNNPNNEKLSEVATLDGCWLGTRKLIAQKYKFDDVIFKNYHCYDLDFCLNVGQDYKVIVTYDILITHLSLGGFDKKWLEETLKLHNKWQNLPRKTEEISKKEIFYQEYFAYCDLVKKFDLYNDPRLMFSISFSKRLIKILGLKDWLKFHLAFVKFTYKQKV